MTERLLLRWDPTEWKASAASAAPHIYLHLETAGFWDPSLIRTYEAEGPEVIDLLRDLLSREPSAIDLAEWEVLHSTADPWARRSRARLGRALTNPAMRITVHEREAFEPIGSRRPAVPGTEGWWPRITSAKQRSKLLEESDHWNNEAAAFILSCKDLLPVNAELENSSAPKELARHLCGGRRTSTLKARVREARKLQNWLMTTYGTPWISRIVQLLDYICERAREPCAASVPKSILACVDFVESVGGIQEANRSSYHPTVVSVFKDITIELKCSKPLVEKRKAPQTLLAMIIGLEDLVTSVKLSNYVRVAAWTRLLRIWMSLRFSDTLHMPPSKAVYDCGVLTVTITRTKTTGPGKKIEVLKAYIGPGVWIHCSEWLHQGWMIFVSMGASSRLCWLPKPSRDLQSFTEDPPTYMDSCGISRKLFGLMKCFKYEPAFALENDAFVPVIDGDGEPLQLLMPGVQAFWMEHSDRAVLPGWTHLLEYNKETRDMLGRWSPQNSDEYLRVAKTSNLRTQTAVAAKVRGGLNFADLGEDEALYRLGSFMEERGFTEDEIAFQKKLLRMPFYALADPAPKPVDIAQILDPLLAPEVEDLSDVEMPDALSAPEEGGVPQDTWVLRLEKGGRSRTLHKVGWCWRTPGIHYASFETLSLEEAMEFCRLEEDVGTAASASNAKALPASRTRVCKNCFPKGGRSDMGHEDPEETCSGTSGDDSP